MFADYQETAEEAANIARLALPWISKNALPAIPLNYAVAYEIVSGRNKNLSKDTEQVQKANKQISQECLNQLFNKYFSHGVDIELIRSVRTELSQVFSEALSAIAESGSGMTQYSEKLHKANKRLNDELDVNVLRDVVSEMINETKAMQESTKSLQAHLDFTCNELEILKTDFQKVQEEIFNDPLTGILNRRGLDKILDKIFAQEQKENSISILMIDIDHFKIFNDNFGHVIGDEVIKYVASTISDNVKGRDITARFGGEEFIVVLPDTELVMAERVALKLSNAIKAAPLSQRSTGRKLGNITISIGVTSNAHNEFIYDIIDRADKALYTAKKNGRDRVYSSSRMNKITYKVV